LGKASGLLAIKGTMKGVKGREESLMEARGRLTAGGGRMYLGDEKGCG
jgi:hypothetical protein